MAGRLNPPRPAKFFKEGAKDTKVRMLFFALHIGTGVGYFSQRYHPTIRISISIRACAEGTLRNLCALRNFVVKNPILLLLYISRASKSARARPPQQ